MTFKCINHQENANEARNRYYHSIVERAKFPKQTTNKKRNEQTKKRKQTKKKNTIIGKAVELHECLCTVGGYVIITMTLKTI